jgi:hypothetical protein
MPRRVAIAAFQPTSPVPSKNSGDLRSGVKRSGTVAYYSCLMLVSKSDACCVSSQLVPWSRTSFPVCWSKLCSSSSLGTTGSKPDCIESGRGEPCRSAGGHRWNSRSIQQAIGPCVRTRHRELIPPGPGTEPTCPSPPRGVAARSGAGRRSTPVRDSRYSAQISVSSSQARRDLGLVWIRCV